MSKKLTTLGAVAALTTTALVPTFAMADDSEVRIGLLYPTSGPCQIFGSFALEGTEMLVEGINANGGLNGKPVVLVHRDSKCDPSEATAMARELIAREEVDFLIGGVSSSEGQAISAVAKQEETIYIAAIPKTTQITNAENFHKYVFRAAANTNTEGKSAAILADRLGLDRICTILMDYSYGHSLDEAFSAHIAQIRPGAEIVAQEWPKNGTTDYTAHITNLMAAGCDGVFSGIWGGLFPAFAKQAAPFGFFQQVEYITAGEVGSPEIAEQMGADMPEGIWANSYEVFYFPETPEHLEFTAAVNERLGVDHAPSWPVTGYVSAKFLTEAIAKAGTDETDAVIAALEGLTIDTPIGPQHMRASDHQANRGQFWGKMVQSSDAAYPYRRMDPVEYIPADDIMD
ncbi:ABC transporter substrate-binding protein [Jannaschia sp. M317]|uniref:ABC transporter substrate-binding protein n=1 Tax=Jannaschia sp. M317 TaxID=2867011 RepID=UPI0021A2BE77|nr:ABC transporter substrate-binding protein [Jannaschia sp. M317]UWQ17899.1 ABC transporter substrate-binding protein [Jannaschia sp. M317]